MTRGSNQGAGWRPNNPQNAQSPNVQGPEKSPQEQLQELNDQELERQKTLMDMLIEDARAGRVKDPEGRNAKGRHDKKIKATKVGRKSRLDRALEKSEDSTLATPAIEAATDAVGKLKQRLTDDAPEGEKIVQRHKLV